MVIDARKRFPIKVSLLSVREGKLEDVVRRAQLWEDAREKYKPDLERLRKLQKQRGEKPQEKSDAKVIPLHSSCRVISASEFKLARINKEIRDSRRDDSGE